MLENFRRLSETYGYPDLGVMFLMRDGVDLEGQVPVSDVFPPCFHPAEKSLDKIAQEAPAARKSMLEDASKPSPHNAIIVEKTHKEAFKGWASEPLDPASLEPDSLINGRFAVIQKSKPRVIDDCSASGLNASVQKTESPKPQSTDLLGSLCENAEHTRSGLFHLSQSRSSVWSLHCKAVADDNS